MSIRIYALAKQLKLEAKLLLEVCAQIGITDKGSALASLTDEEVAKLKAHLGGKGAKGGASAAGSTTALLGRGVGDRAGPHPGTLRREDYMAPAGTVPRKVPVLDKKPERPPVLKKPSTAEPKPEVEAKPAISPEPQVPLAPPLPEAPQLGPQVAAEPVTEPAPTIEAQAAVEPQPAGEAGPAVVVAAPVPEAAPPLTVPPESAPPESARRVEETEKRPREVPEIKPKEKPPAKPEKKEHERRERVGPAVKLAPVPVAQKPLIPPEHKEPAPQKPDIKLPLDAIRASKAGAKPLAEHLRKQEEKRRAETQAPTKKPPPKPLEPEPSLPTEAPPTSRERRGRRDVLAAEMEDEAGVMLGGREQRQLKRKRSAAAQRRRTPLLEEEEEHLATPAPPRRLTRLRRRGGPTVTAPRKSHVVVELPCTVRSFSEALGLPVSQVLGKLLELGVVSNVAAELNSETAALLAMALGVEIDLRQQQPLEERLIPALEQPDDPAALKTRPPIVTFLGHVDHGKTSLLDRIIGLDVAAHEKGGITQHIRAYQVEKDGRPITFVDTPGHEAFTAMRARGANVTDIAVLVVAADDGVMPQTQEAVSHARAANVPIVVALNKIDLPGARPDRVMQQLAANDLLPSDWGGDTEVVQTSAVTGQGIDQLLETLLTVAELHEYRADPNRPAVGTCLEAEVQQGRGVVAKMLVQKGTLRVGDILLCGLAHGRVKAMYDTLDPYCKYQEAKPSMPVNLTGLDVPPTPGDRFYVLPEISQARQIAEERLARSRRQQAAGPPAHVTLETLYERLGQKDQVQTLNIILRADVRGSNEAILKELTKLQHPEVQIKVLQAMVGGISEADVHLADASDAVIIGFNVVPDEKARTLAEQLGVQIRRYDVIYQVTEDLKAALEGLLKPEHRETELGRALVLRIFHISRVGTVAGCRVLTGSVQRDGRVRLIRENRIIGDYPIESLRREKDDVREVREGYECGIKLAGFNDLKEGDIFEVYKVEEIRRTF